MEATSDPGQVAELLDYRYARYVMPDAKVATK